MISAMVLAAGQGTRLRPLTDHRPKPLVPIGDRPALDHIVEPLRSAGIERIVLNAHHRREAIAAYAGGRGLLVSDERDLLGTAGGVAHAGPLLGPGDVLIWNGDILTRLDIPAVVASHAAAATLVVAAREGTDGNVGIDARGRVVRLRRETVLPGEVRTADFLGIHVLGEELRKSLPDRGCLIADLYLPALRRGVALGIFETREPFTDVGTVAAYEEANWQWLAERDAFVHPRAHVADGVRLQKSIVGADAVIDGRGVVERAIVWPGARLTAPASHVIATPEITVGQTR